MISIRSLTAPFIVSILAANLVGCTRSSEIPRPAKTELSSEGKAQLTAFCTELQNSITRFKWGIQLCENIPWTFTKKSIEGRPLIYAEFGDPDSKNRTLILSMVHPDEITPMYLGFQAARFIIENPKIVEKSHVVIAPMVNPDGHFRKPPIRMNAKGVDVNRNFETKDWHAKALPAWNGPLGKNPRRFPGHLPNSEPETKFQAELIESYRPTKILSIHAPLNVMDYDGPSALTLARFPKEYVQECLKLRNSLRARSTGFFPGSLGNYAGQEKGIPTITLELPSADPRKGKTFWEQFREGIRSMIEFPIESDSIEAAEKAPA